MPEQLDASGYGISSEVDALMNPGAFKKGTLTTSPSNTFNIVQGYSERERAVSEREREREREQRERERESREREREREERREKREREKENNIGQRDVTWM